MVLNNLRVFLIFDWLQLVRDFLRMPVEKPSGGTETRERWPSNTSTDSGSGATASATTTTMPKTVKSGVVTKRSTVPVTQERYLEVKINVTGQRGMIDHFLYNLLNANLDISFFGLQAQNLWLWRTHRVWIPTPSF